MLAGYPWYAWGILGLSVVALAILIGIHIWDAVKRHNK